ANRVLFGRDPRARWGGSARAGDGALPGARAATRFGLGTVSAESGDRRTFPLIQRRRRPGLPFGEVSTRRRGHGVERLGHRLYEPGDPVAWIDWFASARLSATTGTDAFVVRQRAADEAPRVVVAVDRSPAMALYPQPLPWLAKRGALREAGAAIVSSAPAARADTAPPGPRGSPRACARVPRPPPQPATPRHLRFPAVGLPRAALGAGLAVRTHARLGDRARCHPGSGVGTQLPRRRRRRCADRP